MKRLLFYIFLFLLLPFFANASLVNKANNTRLTNGLVGYWTFDGPDINLSTMKATDKTGNGTNGTMEEFATSSVSTGVLGQALQFNGFSSDILPGYNAAWNLPTAHTVSAWVKIKKAADGTILRVSDSSSNSDVNDQYEVKVLGTGVKYTTGNGSTVSDVDTYGSTIPLNTWTLITCTLSTGNKSCYKNGVLISTATNDADTTLNTPTTAYMGTERNVAGNDFFWGTMDDVRLYNRALSAREIYTLYTMGTSGLVSKSPTSRSTNGLVGLWTFDGPDMVSNVADRSGQGNHGSMLSFTSTTTAQTTGQVGQGLKFDGADDYVALGSPASLAITGDITVMAWIKANSIAAGARNIITNNNAGGGAYVFNFTINRTAGKVNFAQLGGAVNAGTFQADGDTTIPLNKWIHVAAVRTGSSGNWTITFYYNGVADGVKSIVRDPSTNQTSAIGREGALSGGYFPGAIDEVRVYNRALSATEVKTIYNQSAASTANKNTNARLTNGLIGLWTFDGPNMLNGVLRDVSSSANHAYLSGISTSTFYTTGKIGQAGNFDGVNDKAISTNESLGTGPLTISAWVYNICGTNVCGVNENIIDNQKTTLFFSTNNSLRFTSDGVTSASSANSAVNQYVWMFVTVTRDAAGLANFYINGALSGSANQSSGTPAAGTTNVVIGGRSADSTRRWFGKIDDVRVYNRVLTVAEINQVYNLGR